MQLNKLDRLSKLSNESETCCSAPELAALFQLTPMRIQQLVYEGLPKKADGQYPLRECVSWYVKYLHARLDENQNQTIVAEKLKLYRAKAERAEIETKQLAGSSLDAEKVKQDLIKIFSEIKEEILSLSGCAMELENRPSAFIKNFLNKRLSECLNRIAMKVSVNSDSKSGGVSI